jgi:DNA-binding MarR family transcriptional regulator
MSDLDSKFLRLVVAECPGFQARATARAVTRHYNAYFNPLGLTGEQFSLLAGIAVAEGTTLIELAASSGVDATTVSRNVRNVENRGLIRAEGGRGRAGKRLSLTSTGRRLLASALPAWRQATAELGRRLGSRNLRLTRRAIEALAKAAAPS